MSKVPVRTSGTSTGPFAAGQLSLDGVLQGEPGPARAGRGRRHEQDPPFRPGRCHTRGANSTSGSRAGRADFGGVDVEQAAALGDAGDQGEVDGGVVRRRGEDVSGGLEVVHVAQLEGALVAAELVVGVVEGASGRLVPVGVADAEDLDPSDVGRADFGAGEELHGLGGQQVGGARAPTPGSAGGRRLRAGE